METQDKKLNDQERLVVALLAGWTILHVILLSISHGSTSYFWPFDQDPSLRSDYDFSEFAVYALIPWLIFLIYQWLKSSDNKKE